MLEGIQTSQNFKGWTLNSKILGCKIQTPPNFRGVVCNLTYFLYMRVIWIIYISLLLTLYIFW